ncbi:guanylate kinase [Flavicella sp.]|uniref:guanylate kinase n=1 Tax=Flavicella sp. TaxID=2957742 RepID=UPI00261227C9|nr:guanylate kinase [Flavicella sp.]MDG1805033.1 guanylate kinase [Flavicella sp.]MDG2281199.1 guanylate kinase [Flavicella sp.]
MAKGKLIVFSAPSGSGKTTIVRHLLTEKALGLDFSISATSRQARGQEEQGKDYYFLSPEEFKKKAEADAFLEWEEVYTDNCYGTLKSELDRIWSMGKHVVFDIDVIGGLNIKKQFPEETLAVFVKPPSVEEMEKRLRLRQTDSEEKILERVAKAEKEISYAKDFDVILINDDLEVAKKDAFNLVNNFIQK